MRQQLVVTIVVVLLAAFGAAGTAGAAQDAAKSRITTASGVRVRREPRTGAEEVGRLPLGVVVRELERSAQKERVGEAEDFWFRVTAPGGVEGWVFGGLTAAFEDKRREEIYRQLASAKVANSSATFAELSDLVVFLERAVTEITQREALAELELARLVALQRSLASIGFEDLQKPPYVAWTKAREAQVVYSEPAGQWYVRAELFWDLQRKFQDLPAVAERIAWEGAQAPLPGECEGYLPCHLYLLAETEGRYLKLYPRGAHVADALKNIADFFGPVNEDAANPNPSYAVPDEDRAEFLKTLAELRANIAPVQHALRERVLAQLDELARRFSARQP